MQQPTGPPGILDRSLVRGAIAAALLGAIVLGVLAYRALANGDDGATGETAGAVQPSGTATPDIDLGPLDDRAPERGEPAPDFVLRTLDGRTVSLGDLRGKVVLINFWATWCIPCKRELPEIQRVYDEKRGEGLEVLLVNAEESADDAGAFLADLDVTLPALLDADGDVYEQYRLRGLPATFFVARDGTLATLQFGQVTEQNVRDKLADAGLP